MSAVQVSDETIAAVAVGLAHHGLIGPAARQAVADDLATANRWWVYRGDAAPVVGYPWRWRALVPAVELLTRLDWLRANVPAGQYHDLGVLRELTIERLDGYGDERWRR